MKAKDWGLFWLIGLIWGTSFLWIKIAVGDVTPMMLVAFRTLFGAIGTGILILLNKNAQSDWSTVKNHLLDFFLLGLFNIAVPWLLVSWSQQFIDSGTAAILNGTMPLFTIILSPIFVKEDRITVKKLSGLLIGFIGVVILMSPSIQGKLNKGIIGQVVILLATFCYASSTVFARKRAHSLPGIMQAFLQLINGTTIIWILTLFIERPLVFPQQPITWLALVWLGLLGSCVAFSIYFSLLQKIGPTRMSMVTYIPPLIGMILGIVFLGETFHWQAFVGALLILSGIIIVNLKQKTPQKKQIV